MKVLFITGEYPPMRGGIADHVASLRVALHRLGISSAALTSTSARNQRDNSLDFEESLPLIKSWGPGSWPLIAKTVKRTEADIVHLQYQTGAFSLHPAVNLLPIWLRLRLGVPVVTTMHDLREPYIFPKAGPLRRLATMALALSSAAVVATNQEDLQALTRMRSIKGSSSVPEDSGVYPIPLGNNLQPVPIDPRERLKARRDLGLPPDGLVLCHFGLLNRNKGVDTLFSAYKGLLATGTSCDLLMLGEDLGSSDPTNVSYKQMLKGLAKELEIADRVFWTGYLSPEKLTRAFLASDICILPYEDGASLRRTSLLTALSHGVPVITTSPKTAPAARYSQLFPAIAHGGNCLMVSPRSPQAIVDAVIYLNSEPAVYKRVADGGRALTAELSWDRVAARTAEMYSKLVETKEHALARG